MVVLFIAVLVYNTWLSRPTPVSVKVQQIGGVIDTSTPPLVLQAGPDKSVIVVIVKDTSSDYSVSFSYNTAVDSILGNQINDFAGKSYMSPEGIRYLVLPDIPYNASEIGLIRIATSNVNWAPSAQMTKYDIAISDVSTSIGQDGGSVSGKISNGGSSEIADVNLSSLVFDASGMIVGASRYDIGSLGAGAKESFGIPFPAIGPRTAGSIDKTKTEVFYEATEN